MHIICKITFCAQNPFDFKRWHFKLLWQYIHIIYIYNLYEHTNAYYINLVSELVTITFFWRFSRRIGAKLFASFVFEVAVVWELFSSVVLFLLIFFFCSLENVDVSRKWTTVIAKFRKKENFIRDLYAIDLKIPRHHECFLYGNVQKTRFARNRIISLRHGQQNFFSLKDNFIRTRQFIFYVSIHNKFVDTSKIERFLFSNRTYETAESCF